jgi:hypothetical protein
VGENAVGEEDDEGKLKIRKESEESEVEGWRVNSTVEGEPQIRAGRRALYDGGKKVSCSAASGRCKIR